MPRIVAWNADGAGGWKLLHPDLPADGAEWTAALLSHSELEVHFDNERPDLPALTPWLTALGVVDGGNLRAFGVVTDRDADDEKLTVVCRGLTGYLDGLPWTDATVRRYDADPGELIRLVWDTAQGHRWGNLGVNVDRVATNVRVGEKRAEVKDADGKVTESAVDEPYTLDRSETHDLGAEVDALLAEAGLEFREVLSLSRSGVPGVRMHIGPNLGRRRTDVRAEVGESVYIVPSVEEDPEDYASDVLLIGAGEGPARIVAQEWLPTMSRLRRVYVYQAQDIYRQAEATAEAARVLATMQPRQGAITSLEVMDSPSFPVWTIEPGDELRLTGHLGAAGHADRWVRVIAASSSLETPHQRSLEVVDV